jgi:hypothetical protein
MVILANETEVKTKITTEDKTGPGTKSATGNFQKLKETLGDAVKGMTGFDLATIGVAGVLTMATNEARKAITEYSSYVEQVDKMTMATGMGAEEMSRLVQVADDFRVDVGQLEGALGMALKNGFEPTTANLAKLADEINGISSPTERAKRMTEIFGKSWETVIPLLDRGGAAIREASNNISDGLTVTEEAIKANREYVAAVDELGDSWTSFTNTLARDTLPVLTELLNRVNEGTKETELYTRMVEKGMNVEIGAHGTLKNGAEIRANMASAARMAGEAIEYQRRMEEEATPAVSDFSVKEYEAAQASREWAGEAAAAAEALDRMRTKSEEAAAATIELQNAQQSLAEAQANWSEKVGGDVAGMLDESKLGADKYAEGLKAIDAASGTNLAMADELEKKQAALVEQYNLGKIGAGEFQRGIEMLTAAYSPLDESIVKSQELMDELIGKMENFARTWTATVRVNVGGGDGTSDIGAQERAYNMDLNGNGIIGAKTGLSNFRVPPGYDEMTGSPFMVAVSSGEEVNVTPVGKKGKNGDTYILNTYHTRSPQAIERSYAILRARAEV